MKETPTRSRVTLEEYERLRDEPGYRSEVSRGWLVREPQPGAWHGEVTGRLYRELDAFVRARGLGKVTNQTGFELSREPLTVRGPDVGFVRRARVPAEPPAGFWPGAPDLAVEVVSPSNTLSELQEKVIEYFDAGATQVWVIESRTRSVIVYHSLTDIAVLREPESLSAGDLLPGFAMPIAHLFEW